MGILYSMWCNIIQWVLGTGSAVVPEEGTDPVPKRSVLNINTTEKYIKSMSPNAYSHLLPTNYEFICLLDMINHSQLIRQYCAAHTNTNGTPYNLFTDYFI
jgi:hypothetical protein